MSTDSPLHVIVISSVRPEPTSAGQIILHRHLVDQPGITLEVYGGEPRQPGISRLIRRVVGRLSRTCLRRWAEDFWVLWEGRWLDRELRRQVADPRNTLVLTVAHGDAFMAAQRFARRHQLPLVALFQDWWPDIAQVHRPIQQALEKGFRNLYRTAGLALCICPGMRDTLGEHARSYVLYPVPEKLHQKKHASHKKSAPFKILYFGNLEDYGPMLGEVLNASLHCKEVFIEVRGSNPKWPEEMKNVLRGQGRWLDFAPRRELDAWLASADAFLVPMSFDPALKRRMETSFPSKISEFAQFGVPLLIWAPSYASASIWCRESGAGLVVADASPTALLNEAVRLADDTELWNKLAARVQHAAAQTFNPEAIQANFVRFLKSTRP